MSPALKSLLTVDDLWRLVRVGGLSLAPDGRHAVCSVTRHRLDDDQAMSTLWLLPTDPGEGPGARQLTRCGDKDGQPAWSPRGDRIAFLGRRRGHDGPGQVDKTAQLYCIAPDGGEARRHSRVAAGIESFKWLPDGRRIVFSAWVWPHLKGSAAQARQHKAFEERKESAYVTSEAFYRHWDHHIPQGRVLHLLLLDLASGRVTDLFEGTACELPRDAVGNEVYDVSPDGRRIAFVHDPAPVPLSGNRLALAEIDLRSRKIKPRVDDRAWDFGAPRFSPDGRRLAVLAAHVAR
ncbi:MAG: PD40 domain-containing protein, partial [Chitinophagaceae bacterium]|nr:PD40 domain-containing protein [Rubrivivax sp.]